MDGPTLYKHQGRVQEIDEMIEHLPNDLVTRLRDEEARIQ